MPGPWRRRSAYSGRATPYRRQVDWVTQTQACEQYGLKPADLDAISPIEVVRNPHGGRHPMKKFARSQVEHLVRRLEYEKSLSVEIVRTRAMNQYNLSPDQMDTLVPIRTAANPHKPGTEMRFYNVKDVEQLVEKVRKVNEETVARMAAQKAARATPAPVAGSSGVAGLSTSTAGPSSSQTSVYSSQTTEEDDEDEYGDGGFDDSILSQIELPPA